MTPTPLQPDLTAIARSVRRQVDLLREIEQIRRSVSIDHAADGTAVVDPEGLHRAKVEVSRDGGPRYSLRLHYVGRDDRVLRFRSHTAAVGAFEKIVAAIDMETTDDG